MFDVFIFKENLNPMLLVYPIHIKSYLLKYLSHYQKTDPYFLLTDKNRWGSFLVNSLRHKRQQEMAVFNYDIPQSVKLLVAVPEYYQQNFGTIISNKHVYRFNNALYDDFVERMTEYVLQMHTGRKGDIRMALLAFRERYAINEDELTYKNMEKLCERSRKRVTNYKSG